MKKYDLIIIGGGAGGLVVTSVAAQLGLKVALVEANKLLGGDCLHYGCVPSKTLIHSAHVASLVRRANEYGLSASLNAIDLGRVNANVQSVIDKIQQHDDPERFRDYGAEIIFGRAQFHDSHTVSVNDELISAKRLVIATGSRPAIPPIPGLQQLAYFTNETIFTLQQLPKRLIVLGGGAIGVELAQAFARFGSQVTIIEMFDQLLPAADKDIADTIKQILINDGITIHTATRAVQATQQGEIKTIVCESNSGDNLSLSAECLLVATGRQANIDDLHLQQAGIEHTPRGITVDKRLRTTAKHIYAIGDVVDMPYKFTHMAEYHAGIVLSNAVFHWPKKTSYDAVPSVVYSDPEVATVGLSEQQAQEKGLKIHMETFSFQDVDRALTAHQPHGFAKIILHKNKLIGAAIVGPQAGELIAEFALAIQSKIKLNQLSATIHAYPTLAQINRRVVNRYYAKKLFSTKVKRLVKWLSYF